jgi:hypothetical protein
VRRRYGAVAFLLLAFAGCRSTHAHSPPKGAIVLRLLPAQGLVDARRHGVALVDLHGHRLVWLPRFTLAYFLGPHRSAPLLHGPHGWYRLDATRHRLVPARRGRLPLAGGATVVVPRGYAFTVERRGRVVLRGFGPSFQVVSQRLVQAGRTLLDVETGRRRKLPPGCLFAGFRGRTSILACGVAHGAEGVAPLVLKRMAPGGATRPLSQRLAELVPWTASLSPDRAWVAVEGDTGCAGSWTYVAPTRGGAARLVYGRSASNPFGAYFSSLLGWSADGRLVVVIEPQYCDEPSGPQHPPRGVYLVDPRTLARTFVTKRADAMWSSTPRP